MDCSVDTKLKELIGEVCMGLDIGEIYDDTNLLIDLGIDSVRLIQIVVEIEEYFGIELTNDDILFEQIGVYKNLKSVVTRLLENSKNENA